MLMKKLLKNLQFKNLLLLLTISMLAFSCAQSEDEEDKDTVFITCDRVKEANGQCVRYMDRTIYFANFRNVERNDPFAVEAVKTALDQISRESDLGAGYFQFANADESLLQPLTERTDGIEFRSFIQIWSDNDFNALSSEINSFIEDPNVILALNQANRREFWMIIRGSCFDSNQTSCTNSFDGSFTSESGLRALVARSIGRLVGMSVVDCLEFPDDVLCAEFPDDSQWVIGKRNNFYAGLKNSLELIDNNPEFYRVFTLDP